MTEYGIFSEAAGGCIYAPCYFTKEAEQERDRLVAENGEEAEDLTIEELCPDHEEQPKHGCEDCGEEYAEDSDEDKEGDGDE
ncbi:hypothetical protein [Streptomyces cadmiisoli]|uniref:hypothetical protein n=1 Tax=Streptomyces cadmiisoli TaxID=2184053 RepID=UPI00364E580E